MAPSVAQVSLSQMLAALSTALDLTGGQPAGHSVRTCLIGCRLAEELGLDAADRSALYYALLLKDAGCSSNAARFAELFGSDDHETKRSMKLVDIHNRLRVSIGAIRNAARGGSVMARIDRLVAMARAPEATKELLQTRCDRGAEIVRSMGFPEATANAIRALDEHWCGKGFPDGLRGEAIPLLARIALLAQTVELFFAQGGVEAALRVVKQRKGRWFDPALARRVLDWRRDGAWWESLRNPDLSALVIALEPAEHVRRVDDQGLDVVARAFADIIDAKSPYTFRHSSHVAEYARGIAAESGLDRAGQQRLYRAGLLHDIGKLGVSNRILDSPARLSPEERVEVERHPLHTWEILRRVDAFREFAWLAATHHEKLDGSGYPWKLGAADLDRPARILVVADIYDALTADRPYREGMPHEKAMRILEEERGTKLCPDAIDALHAWAAARDRPVAAAA